MREVKNLLVGLVLTFIAGTAFAEPPCPKIEHPGCWELVALNVQWDPSNPLMKGLDDRPDHGRQTEQAGLERQQRAQFLGPQIWHAQHAGKVQAGPDGNYLVFIYKGNTNIPDQHVTGFKMNRERTASNRIVPENVTGKVKSATGLGEPTKVYRIRAEGISVSIQFPWEMIGPETSIIICREDRLGIYPNKVTLNQGHLISPESFKFLRAKGSVRGLMPFLSTAAATTVAAAPAGYEPVGGK